MNKTRRRKRLFDVLPCKCPAYVRYRKGFSGLRYGRMHFLKSTLREVFYDIQVLSTEYGVHINWNHVFSSVYKSLINALRSYNPRCWVVGSEVVHLNNITLSFCMASSFQNIATLWFSGHKQMELSKVLSPGCDVLSDAIMGAIMTGPLHLSFTVERPADR